MPDFETESYPLAEQDAPGGPDSQPLSYLNADSRTTVGDNGKPSLTIDQAANRLVGGEPGWSAALGVGFTVTYAFRADAPATMPREAEGFQRFNSTQILQTELALKSWADVANIVFVRVGAGDGGDGAYSNQASMLFANYSSGVNGAAAFGSFPGNTSFNSSSGDVWVNVSTSYNASPTMGNYGAQVLVHEIGHAIGLGHPSDYNAVEGSNFTYAKDAGYYEDSRLYTVMSYFSETNTGGNFRGSYAAAPLLDDIAAAQLEYGANMNARTGDTVYGFNSNADAPWFAASSPATRLVVAIWDAGGNDTLDFSGYGDSQLIDLRAGFFSNVGGLVGNVAVAQKAAIENARGGSGADIIHGNALNNSIFGGAGSDSIDGGAGGSNYLRGEAGNDTLRGGADFDDINGNQGNDVAFGGAGNDWVVGGQDQDQLSGEDGNDIVYGNLGNDICNGGDGDDWLRGGQGDDIVDGGAGADLIWGDRGNDTVSGGSGADMFHFFAGAATDRVLDFNGFDGDRVVIDDGSIFTISQSGNDMLITLATGDAMILAGVTPNGLQLGWILLA